MAATLTGLASLCVSFGVATCQVLKPVLSKTFVVMGNMINWVV